MAVRIRKDHVTIVCAAEHKAKKGDTYIDDGLHYILAVEKEVLHTDDEGNTWYFGRKRR